MIEKNMKYKNDNKGFALILSLLIMAMMTAIGIAAVTTATTDMLISKNEYEAKMAFYLAEAGITETLTRVDQPYSSPRYVGETVDQRESRITSYEELVDGLDAQIVKTSNVSPTYGQNFSSVDAGMDEAKLNGKYDVEVTYATEADGEFVHDTRDPEDEAIVLYCNHYFAGVENLHDKCENAAAVFKITSTGTTANGAVVSLVMYVSTSGLNMVPPSGEVYVQGQYTGKAGNAQNLDATVSSNETPENCDAPACIANPAGDPYKSVDMETYLGVPIESINNVADSPSPYVYTDDVPNFTQSQVTGNWGDYCSTGNEDSQVVEDHICDNEAKIIVIDNNADLDPDDGVVQNDVDAVKILGGTGRGILIVKGDLEFAGDFRWEGLIYVMGNVTGSGNLSVFGDIMVAGSMNTTGSSFFFGSDAIALGVAIGIGAPLPVRWTKN